MLAPFFFARIAIVGLKYFPPAFRKFYRRGRFLGESSRKTASKNASNRDFWAEFDTWVCKRRQNGK
ncbi:MAG: hypothetical protein BHW65_04555 [Verrucomicrobia bacterium CAG:312_58_20]|nr:MAG: hypothetical protein BHW65_04555 [Verrucomicrobia bacterium CAG:312_58_20]